MTTHQGIRALVHAGQRWDAGDLDGYLTLYSEDAVVHGYAGVEPGRESIRRFYQAIWLAFPGSRLIFQDVFASGDRVACRFVVQGRHTGPFNGLPATGRTFALPGITILRFESSRCVERWSQADFMSLLQQLGALPPPT